MKMGDRLKDLREKRGLTQKELADIIGVSERVYAYYEQDRFPKDEDIIKNLARSLNTTTSYLLGEKSEEESKFVVLARSAEKLSSEDKENFYKIINSTLGLFLEGKQKNKKND